MARYLCDTNILLRLVDANSPQHLTASSALAKLLREGHELYIASQSVVEFWAVATRPVEANGFGWSRERTIREVSGLRDRFPLIADSPEIFTSWITLVETLPISGKRVHDARIVAILQVRGLDHLLTFNISDFKQFPNLSVVDPAALVLTGS